MIFILFHDGHRRASASACNKLLGNQTCQTTGLSRCEGDICHAKKFEVLNQVIGGDCSLKMYRDDETSM